MHKYITQAVWLISGEVSVKRIRRIKKKVGTKSTGVGRSSRVKAPHVDTGTESSCSSHGKGGWPYAAG